MSGLGRILLFDGQWPEAEVEAGNAIKRLALGRSSHHAGPAFYQQGELHRLRGDIEAADASFRSASALGFDPQPGLALMRLQQNKLRSVSWQGAGFASTQLCCAIAPDPYFSMVL